MCVGNDRTTERPNDQTTKRPKAGNEGGRGSGARGGASRVETASLPLGDRSPRTGVVARETLLASEACWASDATHSRVALAGPRRLGLRTLVAGRVAGRAAGP